MHLVLLYLAYVMATICVYCGAWSTPHVVYVLAIIMYSGMLGMYQVQEGVSLCKSPNLYGVTGHVYLWALPMAFKFMVEWGNSLRYMGVGFAMRIGT